MENGFLFQQNTLSYLNIHISAVFLFPGQRFKILGGC